MLTPEQRAALDALPEKRRRFVVAYVGEAAGNAIDAARMAGYRSPHPEGARLLQIATVGAAIASLRAPAEEEAICGIEELRRLWSQMARTGTVQRGGAALPLEPRDQLKAMELLGKSQGAFLERHEVEHKGTHVIGVLYPDVETATRVARAALSKANGGESDE